ncbi:MAG: amino acid ABC transporter permease, partial [Mesorhizobium sp.]
MASQEILREEPSRGSFINDPKVRGIVFQAVVVIVLVALVWWIVQNTIDNLTRLRIASGFGFLRGRAGFDISDSAIAYSSDSTYGRAIVVGFINTLIVAAAGIVTATIIGFILGVGRLSHNWLIRKICMVYVEVFR